MPWTPKQNHYFRAIEHGWKDPRGGGPSVEEATKMAHEGIKGEKKPKSDFSKAMQSHGVAKGDGKHKRHPSTSHYGMGPQGNRYSKR